MAQRLRGKAAVVTGGGSGGVGKAVAIALAAEGASVVVNDIARGTDGTNIADIVVEEILRAKGNAVANYDSVVTIEGGENIIKTCTSNFGRIDILVNCAGNLKGGSLVTTKGEEWDSVINVHLRGHFSCAKAAALEMIKQKTGRIINISSRAAAGGGSGNVAYCAAKAGILGFTSALSKELKEYGITVNAILPSANTKLFPYKGRKYKTAYPNPISVEPDYVAPIIVYLATDEAQGITDRFIYACGGDLCIFARPLQLITETSMFVRNANKWTIDELSQVIPPLLGLD
jgi:3-oxoacyl-[acyl-carrier protein] reductase